YAPPPSNPAARDSGRTTTRTSRAILAGRDWEAERAATASTRPDRHRVCALRACEARRQSRPSQRTGSYSGHDGATSPAPSYTIMTALPMVAFFVYTLPHPWTDSLRVRVVAPEMRPPGFTDRQPFPCNVWLASAYPSDAQRSL